MKIFSRIIICVVALLAFAGNSELQGQVNLELASEFNLPVESYNSVKVCDSWVCYQTYIGLIIIALDEEGNYGEETLLREDNIFDFSISENYLVITRYEHGNSTLGSFVSVYNLSDEGFPLIHEEFIPNNYQVMVNIVGDYFITGARVYPSEFITKVYSFNNFEQIASYEGLRSYEAIADDKIMIGNATEPITYEIYQVTTTGELELLYSFNQFYDSAIIDNNTVALNDTDKIDFYTITESDSLLFTGTYTLPLTASSVYGFYYQNGVIGYNSFNFDEYCYFDLVDVSDLQNPTLLDSFDFFTITDPDEIIYVISSLIVSNGNNIYPSLANKPLIHLRVEQNSSTSFVEMVQGARSPSYWHNIRDDKLFLQSNIYIQTTDISDPYNPVSIPNNYPIGRYRWFDTEEGVYCTRNYQNLDYLYLYKFGAEDQLILQDSLSVQQSGNVYAIYFDGTEFIYSSEGVITSISYTDEGVVSNWSFSPNIDVWSYAVYVNNYLYITDYGNHINIYHIGDNNLTFMGTKLVDFHSFISVDETERFLSLYGFDEAQVFDLSQDPVNLNIPLNMGIRYQDSNLTYKNGYMMFVGQSSFEINNTVDDRNICIYRETEDGPVHLSSIPLNYSYTLIELLIDDETDNMKIILIGTNGTVIYTGTITPNGDLEIDPVPLNITNYPNPFNPVTTISYDLPQEGEVQLDIFNLKGQKVKTLVNEVQESGEHKVTWQGDNQKGGKVSSGVFFYKLKANGKNEVGKMTLMK